ncbi:MAG: hydantoinase B/oxoprolinase family protein [Reyranellaceae bacterium]
MTDNPTHSRSPIVRELVRNALEAVVDDMALTVVRTSYSNTLRDVMDFSTAICAPDGAMVAQGLTLPLHLGAFPDAIASVLARFGDGLAPGDVYVMNDPYRGGMHLPDVFMFRPVFAGPILIGFAAIVGHQADIGGRAPGGNACDSTEIFQEGLRIGPTRLVERGVDCRPVWELIGGNVRMADRVLGDFRAQIAALKVGERELLALAERYSPNVLVAYYADLLDAAERLAREEISKWPDGEYSFVDHIDDDGINPEPPVTIAAKLVVRGSDIHLDFAGTSAQVGSAINSTMSSTRSAAMLAVRSVMSGDIPNNAGFFRPITVTAPAGTVVNPREPAAVAARALTCFRVVDVVMGAMAQVAPNKVFAAGDGGISVLTMSGTQHGKTFVVMDSVGCCWGGRPDKDGVEGVTGISLNISNIPAEVIERDYPLLIERYGFVPDTGGAGRYRGGLAIEKAYRFLQDDVAIQIRSDRRHFRPYGLTGGEPGAPSATALTAAGKSRSLPSKTSLTVRRGEVLAHRHAGGGGWGAAAERDPAAVLADVVNGKVSAAAARAAYGVVLDATSTAVDELATAKARRERRQVGEDAAGEDGAGEDGAAPRKAAAGRGERRHAE